MKILKYILVLVVALLVVFVVTGLVNSTVSYGHEITVDKPVEEAWAVMHDQSKYDQWLEGFESMKLIEGEPNVPGCKHEVVVIPQEGAEPFVMVETLIDIKENEYIEMHYDSEMMDFEQVYTYSESDGQTTISSDAKVIAKTFIMRCMFACMETFFGSFSAQEAKNMEALKAVINENSTDYTPETVTEVSDSTAVLEE